MKKHLVLMGPPGAGRLVVLVQFVFNTVSIVNIGDDIHGLIVELFVC